MFSTAWLRFDRFNRLTQQHDTFLAIKFGNQKKHYTGCVLTICIKDTNTQIVSNNLSIASLQSFYGTLPHRDDNTLLKSADSSVFSFDNILLYQTELMWSILVNESALHKQIPCRIFLFVVLEGLVVSLTIWGADLCGSVGTVAHVKWHRW